jgi:hypothetical protein
MTGQRAKGGGQAADCGWQLAAIVVCAALLTAAIPHAQEIDARQRAYDDLLDVNVRDGLVDYRVLESQRPRLDRFVEVLAAASIESRPRDEQIAFWLNAYNALVLQTVIDHYPIVQRSRDYPAKSIRQIPGAFERLPHRVAGRTLTLDQIEQTILPAFRDPRVYLALGRGAIGSGRLRSEAYTAAHLERQLTEIAHECVTRVRCAEIDRTAQKVRINAVFSWREQEFVAAYAASASAVFGSRSPIERAGLAFLDPTFLPAERAVLAKNEFTVEFIPFDWTLNDLSDHGTR